MTSPSIPAGPEITPENSIPPLTTADEGVGTTAFTPPTPAIGAAVQYRLTEGDAKLLARHHGSREPKAGDYVAGKIIAHENNVSTIALDFPGTTTRAEFGETPGTWTYPLPQPSTP